MNVKKKILLLAGGPSKERKISLATGKAVYEALKTLGYDIIKIDPNAALTDFLKYNCDLAFNALHGQFGEDGIIQRLLEQQKIRYTHSGAKSSAIAMNKLKSKKKFVIKPINEGSSVGVLIYSNFDQINKSLIKKYLKKYNQLLQEEFVEGKEVQAAVMGSKAIGAIEIKPSRKFYDYKAKYNLKAKTKHIMPANLDKKTYRKVLQMSLKAHKCLSCKGVTRSDFRVTQNNEIFILETNTQPGMTNLSLVPEIAEHYGISFVKLVEWIVSDASINR